MSIKGHLWPVIESVGWLSVTLRVSYTSFVPIVLIFLHAYHSWR